MARTRSFGDICNDAYKMADTENATSRFPLSECQFYANQGLAGLYDLLVSSNAGYFENNTVIVTDGVSTVFPLPPDFYKMLLVQMNISQYLSNQGTYNVPLHQFNLNERPVLSSSTPGFSGFAFAYRIHGGTTAQAGTTVGDLHTNLAIELLPRPSANISVLLYYVPVCPVLSNATDLVDTLGGWDYYASAFAAKMMRLKDDLPTAPMDELMAELKQRIVGMAPKRDQTEPKRINDIRTSHRNGRGRRGGRGNGWGGL